MNTQSDNGTKQRKVFAVLSALAILSTTFGIATAAQAGAACDYRDAAQNGGWGWDSETQTSCAPQSSTTPTVDNCDYSAASSNSGWGWDPVARQSCPPLSNEVPSEVSPEVANITVISRRTDSSGQQAIVSETDMGDLRVVHIAADGETSVIQVEAGSTEFELTTWHYEDRSALNTGLPETLHDALGDNNWSLLPQSQSVFHQDDSVDGNELKFINDDGREAVYYNDGRLVTNTEFAGSYNYVNPRPGPQHLLDIQGILEFAIFGIGHVVADVIPYSLGENTRDEDPEPAPLGTTSPADDSDLDLRDDDDDGIPAGQDLDDKDPNRGARRGTPYADDDFDGVLNYLDKYPIDPYKWDDEPCEGSRSNDAGCNGGGSDDSGNGGGGGSSVQTSTGGSVQTSTGGTVQLGSGT